MRNIVLNINVIIGVVTLQFEAKKQKWVSSTVLASHEGFCLVEKEWKKKSMVGTDQNPSCCPFGFETSRFQQPGVRVWIKTK